jgi:Na+-transporting NADH:ubiquinone oxidoreductase subunit NqrC
MSIGYIIASVLMVCLFCGVVIASRQGWGLSSDAQAMAQAKARSVRTGSTHYYRSYYGGGPGHGK